MVKYLNTLADVGVEAAINLPTRIEILRDRLVSSCLDHVNVRLDQNDYAAFIVEQKLSDHFLLAFEFSLLPWLCGQTPCTPIESK